MVSLDLFSHSSPLFNLFENVHTHFSNPLHLSFCIPAPLFLFQFFTRKQSGVELCYGLGVILTPPLPLKNEEERERERQGEISGSALGNNFLLSTTPQISLLCYNNKYVILGSFLYYLCAFLDINLETSLSSETYYAKEIILKHGLNFVKVQLLLVLGSFTQRTHSLDNALQPSRF